MIPTGKGMDERTDMAEDTATEVTDTADGHHTAGTTSGGGAVVTDGRADDDRMSRGPSTALMVAGLTAVVALPLAVALAALHSPRWYPLLDLAMTELRVRDVGTSHTPLTGLVGRLSSNGNQGSHPGPISFWALAPVYRLLGGSAWGLLVSVVVLNTTAIALTLWIAVRRGGAVLALGFAAAIAVLAHLYGTQVLTEPWNPYMPVMWWLLTLVALWAVLCDDLAMLPVAVVAGSFCMQTHISYLGLVGGLAALALVGLATRAMMRRGDRPALRRLARWTAISLALGVVLWIPPLIDQLTNDPGNASIVLDYFRDADEGPIGLRRGAELFGVHLNPWRLLAGQPAISGSIVPGLGLVAVWLVAAVVTWRMPAAATPAATDGRGMLLRLHAVIAAALTLGLISASRILGFIWYYLTLWAWGTTMLMAVAIVWTAVSAVPTARQGRRRIAGRTGAGLLGGVLVAWTSLFVIDALDAEPTQHRTSEALGDLTVPVLDAIDSRVVGAGRDGRFQVTWSDGTYIGAPGFGLVDELERRGLDVGVAEPSGPGAVAHRVMHADEADAEIHISVGPDIAVWQARPDAVMVAYADPRTDEERARYARARSESIEQLEGLGRTDLVPLVDLAPFMLFLDDSLPEEARAVIGPLGDIGQPLAVFISPPASP
jgi:hypothetical protein